MNKFKQWLKQTIAVPLARAAMSLGLMAAAHAAPAATHTLATPPPSIYLDSEAAHTVQLPQASELTRIFKVQFEIGEATNCCVQVALGTDADGDGDLAPEETDLVLGYDCGAWFWRDERGEATSSSFSGEATSSSLQNRNVSISIRSDGDVASPRATFDIPRQRFDRSWNAAKVTTRGFGRATSMMSPPATITLIYKNTPFVIRIR